MPNLSLSLLGPFQAALDGQPITGFASNKVRALLAYLAVEADRPHSRDELIGLLWPDQPDTAARASLRQALANLRQVIGDRTSETPFLSTTSDNIQFQRSEHCSIDVIIFNELITACRAHAHRRLETCRSCAQRLQQAVELYRGDFLAQFVPSGGEAFEEWALIQRERLHREVLDALYVLAEHHERRSVYDQARHYATRQLELDPWREEAHRQLMRALALSGQRSAALAQYETCRHVLAQELGAEPSKETTLLFEKIRADELARGERRHNLPTPPTPLIGRQHELTEIDQLLDNPSNRLLTLTGSGGIGKTRLAVQAAWEYVGLFQDGIWLIELAPLSDPALVTNTIATVLGLREEQGRPLIATLLDWLRDKQLLFVLDNCEHLIETCARFADAVLQTSRETRILASSREVLGIAGESAYRVPSLRTPDPKEQINIEQLEQYAAVCLFIDRATQALATFNVTNANAPAIAQICYRLDGIPLAIELAAARVKALSPEQIAPRLDDRFHLLTGGSRTALPRHQTLRSLIDWSHNLLSEPERVLLRRLSVFAGGWTLEAAEQTTAGNDLESSEVLDLLTHLVDKSLVVLDEQAAEPRYHMLETIRQYAREKLLDANESEPLRDQHLRFFVELAERAQHSLDTAQRTVWLPRMENEHDNLRAALEWACERDLETARWLAGNLERFWFFGDHLSEARTWYARVLNSGDRATVTKGLALALLGSGIVSLFLGYLDEAQVSFEQSVVFWQKLGVQEWLATSLAVVAYCLIQRGEHVQANDLYMKHELLFRSSVASVWLAWVLGHWGSVKATIRRNDPSAKALLDEALSLAQSSQDPFSILLSYSSLGDWAILQDDYATARRYFLEALEWRRQLGTRWIIVTGLWQVANIMRLQGDYPQAEPMYAEALSSARALGDQRSEAHIALELGDVAIHLGDVERATTLLAESLLSFRKWADPLGIARCLMGFADLRQVRGQVEQAARVLSFVEPWLQSNQIQLVHFDRTNYERGVVAVRAQLDEATFSAACEVGSGLTLEQAIAFALEDDRAI